MKMHTKYASKLFWDFLGLGLASFLIGSGWSVSRAKVYQIELAQYKLQVGSALNSVRQASSTLESAANKKAIGPGIKREIEKSIQRTDAVLEQIELEVSQETDKLLELDEEWAN